MGLKFKRYFKEGVEIENYEPGKWDTILFLGTFAPFNRWEYDWIKDFLDNVYGNPLHAEEFTDNINIGLLTDEDDEETILMNTAKSGILFDEKKYIAGKFFGFKMFGVDVKELIDLVMFSGDSENVEGRFEKMLHDLKTNFHKSNVLIVLDPRLFKPFERIDGITTNFSDGDITIGFTTHTHVHDKPKILNRVNDYTKALKSVIIMDHDKPYPEDLRAFAAEHNLANFIEEIKYLNFKTNNENYFEIFRFLFPPLKIYPNDSSLEENMKFIFELLKKMFLKDKFIPLYGEGSVSENPEEDEAETDPADKSEEFGFDGEEDFGL